MDKALYSFDLNDYQWKDHLRKAGYAVIKNVASTEEINVAIHLLERDLASLNLPSHGLLAKLAQSEGAWKVRGIPTVKQAFTKIWDSEDLIVSMDAIISWRLWKGYDPRISNQTLPPRPQTEGLHLDQNCNEITSQTIKNPSATVEVQRKSLSKGPHYSHILFLLCSCCSLSSPI